MLFGTVKSPKKCTSSLSRFPYSHFDPIEITVNSPKKCTSSLSRFRDSHFDPIEIGRRVFHPGLRHDLSDLEHCLHLHQGGRQGSLEHADRSGNRFSALARVQKNARRHFPGFVTHILIRFTFVVESLLPASDMTSLTLSNVSICIKEVDRDHLSMLTARGITFRHCRESEKVYVVAFPVW